MTALDQLRVWIDGLAVDPSEARVSVFDRGFLYGDSVFETLRTYGGRPFALDAHLARLAESARRVRIQLPVSLAELGRELRAAAGSGAFSESYLRLMVTRGSGELGLDPNLASRPLRVLIQGPLNPPSPEKYEHGIAVVSFRAQRPTDTTAAAGAKVGNYLVAVLAMEQARAHGADEALIVDAEDHVLEGSSSNFFWAKDGRLFTPAEDEGILPGITRGAILEIAAARGLRVDFRTPTLSELLEADELFLSSSIRELLPVVRIDGRPIGFGRPGELTRDLLDAFRVHARSVTAP